MYNSVSELGLTTGAGSTLFNSILSFGPQLTAEGGRDGPEYASFEILSQERDIRPSISSLLPTLLLPIAYGGSSNVA
jgi:hypothetical protein